MGKKRTVTQTGQRVDKNLKARALSKVPKKKIANGILCIEATFNNTKVVLTDQQGNVVMQSSSGALGFKGAKKGTPYAAAKVGEVLGEKAQMIGVKQIDVVIKGTGPGRESAVRSFSGFGIEVNSIFDRTPVPHNGPRPRKPRRV